MAKRELAAVVYIDGEPHGPGEVSAAVAKKIDNPKAWKAEDAEAEAPAEDAGDESGNADES